MQRSSSGNSAYKGYYLLLFTGLVFGTLEVVSKLMPHIGPLQMSFLRFSIGGLVILPFGLLDLKKRKTPVGLLDALYVMVLGILLIPMSMTLLQVSVTKVPASLVALIFSANPMIIAALASLILKERMGLVEAAFVALGMIGIVLIIRPFGKGFDAGILYPLASVTLFGLYIVLARKLSKKLGSLFVTSAAILTGSAVLGLYASATGVELLASLTWKDAGYLVYLGVVVSGLAYVTYFKGMDLTTTNTGSAVFFIKSLVAAVLSAFVLDEVLSPTVYLGGVFIASGIFVMMAGNSIMAGKYGAARRQPRDASDAQAMAAESETV